MSTLKLLTLNCRGLNNSLKRRMFFKTFLDYNICSLQETFITDKHVQLWKSEWSGDFFHINGTTNSNGLIILINKNFPHSDMKEIKVNNRCLGISFTHNDKHFVLFNIYAPSVKEERTGFLESQLDLAEFILPHSLVLLNGDFNMVLNNNQIVTGLSHSNKEIKCFNMFIDKYNLLDTWKLKHPDKEDFSWIRYIKLPNNPIKCVARRLDYIFCNSFLEDKLCHSEMLHFSSTDHKAVTSHFKLDDYPRGKGLWQFSDLLLDEDIFIASMTNFIKEQYISLKNEEVYSNNDVWDLLKIGIRDQSMAFSRNKRINNLLNNNFNEKITLLNSLLLDDPSNINLINDLCEQTKKKEIFELSASRGALKRSRLKFIDGNERNTSFFLSIESHRQEKRVIKEIYDTTGKLVTTPIQIMPTIASFYETLMSNHGDTHHDKPHLLDAFLGDAAHPTLNDEDRELLESPITIHELEEALKLLNSDSAPGCDGLTPLFYSHFWDSVKIPLFESIKESINNELLTLSQRRAVITLLPKSTEKEALRDISFWRPISLLNTDYKLYSKALAIRLQNVIAKLVSDDQVGYIKGRNINDHIRFIDDIINYSKIKHIQGLIVSLDYRKAFATVCKDAIITSLKKFNFGPIFIQYVATIINGAESSIKNAGWISRFFQTSKGVRQGCNLSPLLFILVVELLAIKIRSNANIEGILDQTQNHFINETKLSQYADDMSLYLKNVTSLKLTLHEIDQFTKFSGLALNRKKSIAMWIGKDKDNEPGEETLKWLCKTECIKILGIYFNAIKEASLIEANWDNKIEEIHIIMNNWTKRNCSIWGKTIVAKTFLLSKLNYILQSLNLPINIQQIIDNMIFKFIWKTKSSKKTIEKIKRSTLCLNVKDGGLSMVSIETQQKVLLLRWLHRLLGKKDRVRKGRMICLKNGRVYM